MSEMINRAVEALKRLPVRDREAPGGELDELRLREAVRAVIQSMREPTQEVYLAGRELAHSGDEDQLMNRDSVKERWRVMIDAALK